MKRTTLVISALFLLTASNAWAQPEQVAETKDEDGWQYKFEDDLLNAPGVDAGGPVLVVRKLAGRERLIRPRLSFVQEMFKSVEKL